MNFKDLFENGTPDMQKKKKFTFMAVIVTAALLVVALLSFSCVSIAQLVSNSAQSEQPTQNSLPAGIGQTTSVSSASYDVHSGDLLLLGGSYRFKGQSNVVAIGSIERPKTNSDSPVYTIGPGGNDRLCATEATITAFNSMIEAFYSVSSDDNIIVANAYNKNEKEAQEPTYLAGNTLLLKYFVDPLNDTSKRDSICGVDTYDWIYKNAHKYGFTLLPPEDVTADKNLSSTFRYVGVAHATQIKNLNVSFDEYIARIRAEHTPESPMIFRASNKTFAVYYLQNSENLTVPSSYAYTISGDNISGYIVTVELS